MESKSSPRPVKKVYETHDDEKREPSRSPNKLDLRQEFPGSDESKGSEDKSFNASHEDIQKYSFSWQFFVVCFLILSVAILCALKSKSADTKIEASTEINCTAFLELAKKFPNVDEKIFKHLQVSTEGLYNRNGRPSVTAFFSTDQKILDDLTKIVAQTTKKCICQEKEPISLTKLDLHKEKFLIDHTKIISEYKSELAARTIMVVNNLESLSTDILPSFHSFADTYNPLVKKSILFLTFKVPNEPKGKEKPVDYIINYLNEQWNEMADNIRGPLITRLLDQTFYLNPSH